ncbi:MAG TPA: porin [Burkholderiales bacterium]|nr:porin [Burkholderiales bacterium]
MNIKTLLVIACALVFTSGNLAHADETSALKAKLEELQKQMDALKKQLEEATSQMQQQQQQVSEQLAKQKEEQEKEAQYFYRHKEGDALTIETGGGGEVTLYGYLDVSLDYANKGLKNMQSMEHMDQAVGNLGWQWAFSTNQSYLGVRGIHPLPTVRKGFNFVWQLEAQLDIAAAPGTTETQSNTSDVVKSGLFFRNSYIGLSDKEFGALKFGKTDAPYKTSTARMNPFSGKLGDYAVIMGNSGGDNRSEFTTRVNHAVWYESPNVHGFTLNALASPGQNPATDNSDVPIGEPDCNGNNIPGSGALPPACNDGSFGALYSTNLAYQYGPFYATVAYELHSQTNRSSDVGDPFLAALDVGDERAAKIGIQYFFPTKTTISGIYEQLRRSVNPLLEFQNERSRNGWWLALTQVITPSDNVSFGWGHAGGTPGDPGQHNTPGGPGPDNIANMYTALWNHSFDKFTTVYVDWALTINHRDAHYDLGAGGRALTYDCHDGTQLAAFDPTTGTVSGTGPHCWAGSRIEGVSAGLSYKF